MQHFTNTEDSIKLQLGVFIDCTLSVTDNDTMFRSLSPVHPVRQFQSPRFAANLVNALPPFSLSAYLSVFCVCGYRAFVCSLLSLHVIKAAWDCAGGWTSSALY